MCAHPYVCTKMVRWTDPIFSTGNFPPSKLASTSAWSDWLDQQRIFFQVRCGAYFGVISKGWHCFALFFRQGQGLNWCQNQAELCRRANLRSHSTSKGQQIRKFTQLKWWCVDVAWLLVLRFAFTHNWICLCLF